MVILTLLSPPPPPHTHTHTHTANHCFAARAKTCSECLQTEVGCAYCTNEVRAQNNSFSVIFKAQNSSSFCIKQTGLLYQAINMNLQKSQVSPQKMVMSFLPGEQKQMNVEVFAPTKGPLDLYILMDFSNSMEDDLDNLKKMAKLVNDLSDDPTIGFGKFVDKVTDPQTDMRQAKLKQPWPNSDPPFSFQNVIPLMNNTDSFIRKLQKEKISGNLDAPEGGFDAILQAAVCVDKIGWRSSSTHLLVFSTESAFHYESDGANVLAGIMARNDEACHLDPQGKYTKDVDQDYPSIPTLVRLLAKHNIIPIFAVTNHSYSFYEKLQTYFPIAEIGRLEEDSKNMLTLMRTAFESIRSKMSIRAEDRPKAFEAEFFHTNGSLLENCLCVCVCVCVCVHQGKFKMRLKAQRTIDGQPVCQMDPDHKMGTMRVKPTTFSTAVKVNASVLCPTCPCEKTAIPNADKCYGNGDLVCGRCHCHDGCTFCNCSASSSAQDKNQCMGSGIKEPCSGNGECLECGTCLCNNPDQFEGQYCQYDKTQCQRYGGFLCNDRGSCIMGRCVCTKGWTGNACECPKSNQTCLDSKGGLCNGRGKCVCGRCACYSSDMTKTLGACEGTRSCVQCQAWKTGEKKEKEECDKLCVVCCVFSEEKVLDSCSFRDEDDDCTYYYTVENPKDPGDNDLEVQVLKKKDCPPASFLWLLPLLLFLLLLLALLLLCCWKYCACCKTCFQSCLALLPCCRRGRMVGFKEDEYLLRQSLLTSDHLDTPMVRTGPPKGTDVVRWKVTDNVHRSPNHPQALIKPNPKETIQFPMSLRLNRVFSENLSRPESRDAEQLRKEVADNLNEVYKQIPGAQKVQKTSFRYVMQRNAGKRQDYAIMDTVLPAPRSSYPDIVKLTEKNVQSGNVNNLKVVPGYYTVATDREAAGAIEFNEGVESVDVHVPLFVKDEDDDKKQLLVEAMDVPLGIAEIGKRLVNITIIKEHATSVFSFLQPAYTYSRQDGVANIPISREIIEDGRTQVTYRTRDLTAKDKKDYVAMEGDLTYNPDETQKMVPVRLLELSEKDGLLEDKQVKQFVMDLSNPRQGAKLGRYPRTTVTITDQPGEKNARGFTSPLRTLVPTQSIDSTGPRNIRLNWDPASGNPMGYKVKYWIYGDPEKNAQILDVKTPQAELTNLYPFCDYEMKVCSYNTMGDGQDTDMVTCQTLEDVTSCLYMRTSLCAATCFNSVTSETPLRNHFRYSEATFNLKIAPCSIFPPAPGEPGRLAFNVISPTVTQVSWGEPAETNGNITAYEVIYTPIDDVLKPVGAAKKVKIDNPKKRMLLIENLQSAQTYQYKVRAMNSIGWGPFRNATINLASQPTRPMSIPIIPDIPIVDAEAGDEYDSYLMYSNEVLKSPTGSKTPSVSGDADYTMNGKWDQNFLFPGGSGTRNLSTSSSPMSTLNSNYRGAGSSSFLTDTTTTYMSGSGRKDGSDGVEEKENVDQRSRLTFESSPILTLVGPCHPSDSPLSPGVPDTPSRLVFSALGPTALKVSWQEPRCDKDILGYCVLYQLLNGGEGKRINVTNPAENSVIIEDLLPNHSYLFKVKAQSQKGWGPEREGVITIESAVDPKSPLSPMPGSPFTLSTPSAPGPLVFTALSPESLQLSWEQPRKPNGDILGYIVTCEQLHGGGKVNGDSAETSLTVPNLTENVPYKFKVQARTTQGFGPEREGIITIESQDGSKMNPTDEAYRLGFSTTSIINTIHSHINTKGSFVTDGTMMTTQHTETSGMVTRQVTKEVVQRSVMGGTTVTKKMFYES
uniref:Integrin beta n=1 Tax=Cyclopterus lumpus TaxID=8103 RepID=A0A8C3APD8_CYCLU